MPYNSRRKVTKMTKVEKDDIKRTMVGWLMVVLKYMLICVKMKGL